MSFVRAEVRALARRWAETAAAGVLFAFAAYGTLRLFGLGAIGAWPGLALSLIAAGWLRIAFLRARLARPETAPGIAALSEGMLAYFGPAEGGAMALSEIVRVEVIAEGATGPARWRLTDAQGCALEIPAGAEGAAAVPQGLEALAGFSDRRAAEAFLAGLDQAVVVWESSPGHIPDRLGLSPP